MQIKKPETEKLIQKTALSLFAEKGYRATTMADIAEKSGISVGNIYRYYKTKEEIYRLVVPENLTESLSEIIREKIQTWKETGGEGPLNLFNSQKMIGFLLEFRLALITVYRTDGDKMTEGLASGIFSFLFNVYPMPAGKTKQAMIGLFYKKMVEMIAEALLFIENREELEEALNSVHTYHMFGITGVVAGENLPLNQQDKEKNKNY